VTFLKQTSEIMKILNVMLVTITGDVANGGNFSEYTSGFI